MGDRAGCPWCGKALVRKEGETLDNFERRRYCGKRHASLHGNEQRHHKEKRSLNAN